MNKNFRRPLWAKEAKKALIDRDMTCAELAEEIGVSRCYVSQVVNGSRYVPELAQKISVALELEDIPYSMST